MLQEAEKINVDCIIPAAGLSSRMGKWKLTLPYQDRTIIEASIRNALTVCTRVILVTGYRASELCELIGQTDAVEIVVNHDFEKGMVSSIQKGTANVKTDHFFIAHGDMPCIDASIYQQMWHHRTLGTVFPGNKENSGHPVLISTELKAPILNATPYTSMKSVLAQFPTTYLNMSDPNLFFDVDTPDAYQSLLRR